MDELSNEDKEDAEGRKTLFKNLMKINFQKNTIRYIFTNIMSIDEKINEAHKDEVNIKKSEEWKLSQ